MKRTIYVMLNNGSLEQITYDNISVAEENKYELVIEFAVEEAFAMDEPERKDHLAAIAKKLQEKENVEVRFYERMQVWF